MIVDLVARQLSELDPPNADRYRANATKTQSSIRQLHTELRKQLRPVHKLPYLVFHDAYGYFERDFGLDSLPVTNNPHRPLGAKRVRELKQLIRERNIRCVFNEPQFQAPLLTTLVADTQVRIGTLDPLGAELTPGREAWFELLRGLGDGLRACLLR